MDKDLLDAYESALCLFCRQSALLEHYTTCRSVGVAVPDKEMKKALVTTKLARERFLDAKESLGIEGGLSFMEKDAVFFGFSYRNHTLSGDYSHLTEILWPLADMPVNRKSCFKHEVAVLLLSHYYMQMGKYKMPGYFRFRIRQLQIKIANIRQKRRDK